MKKSSVGNNTMNASIQKILSAQTTRFTVSLRAHYPNWAEYHRFQELLDFLVGFRDVIDEVALFSSSTHSPLPLAELESRAGVMAERIPALKALGLRVGINHLATIGHLDENLENSLNEPWQRLVDRSGKVSQSNYCASDPKVQEYIRKSYASFTSADPDFIWLDDDLRLESHSGTVDFACFCPFCLEEFGRTEGVLRSREELLAAFKTGADQIALRTRWLARNRRYATRILDLARSEADKGNGDIALGLMTTNSSYSGYGFPEWARAMAGPRHLKVKFRPGGGFYSDESPLQLLAKLHAVGRQNAFVPPEVTDIQYELESFPYLPLNKSRTMFQAELFGAAAVGCTGAALNVLNITGDPLDEFGFYFQSVRESRTLFDQMVDAFGQSPCEGIWNAFTPDHNAVLSPGQDWPGPGKHSGDLRSVNELWTLGLPPAYTREGASVTLLLGDSVLEWSKEDLVAFLSGGVLLDGPALQRLEELGLAELAGWKVAGTCEADISERFTGDPLNGRFGGWHRDCRPSFWPQTTWLIEPLLPNARALAEARNFTPETLGHCAGVFENHLGGRVAILGYYPWTMLGSLAKTTQMRELTHWLGRGHLPALVESFHRMAIWCRRDADGSPAFALINASQDPAEGAVLRIRDSGDPLCALQAGGKVSSLRAEPLGNGYQRVVLPTMPPWNGMVVCSADDLAAPRQECE